MAAFERLPRAERQRIEGATEASDMTKLSEAELNELLRTNPDVALAEPPIPSGSAKTANTPMHRAAPAQHERALQAAIFAEAERRAVDDPRWALLFPTVNGQYRPGQRPEPGLSHATGIPDLCLPVASWGFHGLWIELKVGKNKPSDAQRAWLKTLNEQGYYAALVWDSVQKVVDLIEWYLDGDAGLRPVAGAIDDAGSPGRLSRKR